MTIDVIKLIKETVTLDSYGDRVLTTRSRQVFVEVRGVGQKEFYQAQAVGLQPELRFCLRDYLDYEGEQVVEYNSERYRVFRTFREGQSIELTVYREVNQA